MKEHFCERAADENYGSFVESFAGPLISKTNGSSALISAMAVSGLVERTPIIPDAAP
jgi:hypothetical protein